MWTKGRKQVLRISADRDEMQVAGKNNMVTYCGFKLSGDENHLKWTREQGLK